MEKLFIPYELALIAKEKGFDEPCFGLYKGDQVISVGGHWGMKIGHSMVTNTMEFADDEILAPLYQQIVDWFREKHRIDIYHLPVAKLHNDSEDQYAFHIFSHKYGCCVGPNSARSPHYYKLLNVAIEEAFKLI